MPIEFWTTLCRIERLRAPHWPPAPLSLLLLSELRRHADDEWGRRELARFAELPEDTDAQHLVEEVARLLEVGRARHEVKPRPVTSYANHIDAPVALADLGPVEEVTIRHAIVVELVGEDDEPISGVRYEVILPGGTTQRGRLDGSGRVEFRDLKDAGTCQVRFPDLDQDAWEHIESLPL